MWPLNTWLIEAPLYYLISLDLCRQEELVELLLDHFQVEACYLQEQGILAMYSYSAISGIVGESS